MFGLALMKPITMTDHIVPKVWVISTLIRYCENFVGGSWNSDKKAERKARNAMAATRATLAKAALLVVMLAVCALHGAAQETEGIFNDADTQNAQADSEATKRAIGATSAMVGVSVALVVTWCIYGTVVDRDALFARASEELCVQ